MKRLIPIVLLVAAMAGCATSQMRNEYDPKDGRRKVDVLFVPVWR